MMPGAEGSCQAHITIYSITVCVYIAEVSVCCLCHKSVLFYEAVQTQGVIVIYEAPCWLWRLQSDQKYTHPSTQKACVSTYVTYCVDYALLDVFMTLFKVVVSSLFSVFRATVNASGVSFCHEGCMPSL